jgi:hypothetical protein
VRNATDRIAALSAIGIGDRSVEVIEALPETWIVTLQQETFIQPAQPGNRRDRSRLKRAGESVAA